MLLIGVQGGMLFVVLILINRSLLVGTLLFTSGTAGQGLGQPDEILALLG